MSGSQLCIPENETVQPLCSLVIFKTVYNVLSPHSYTHISVRDLYISRIGLFAAAYANYVDRSWEYINRSQTHEW